MSDFIREVDEEYRRERAANFLKRFQVPLVALVVLIIAGAGGWRWYVDHKAAQAAADDARYQQAQAQAGEGKPAAAEASFTALAANGAAGYAELSRLRAAEVLGTKDPKAAAEQLDVIASDEGHGSPALRDLARYRGALLRLGVIDPKAFDEEYGRFALDGFAFHNGMRELLALAAIRRDDRPAATKYLEEIALDPLAPPGSRNRAQAFRELVNAGPATTVATAPGPATVTPIAGGPPAAPAGIAPVETLPPTSSAPSAPAPFEPIAPVGKVPQSAMPPSEPSDEPPEPAAPPSEGVPASPSPPAPPAPAK